MKNLILGLNCKAPNDILLNEIKSYVEKLWIINWILSKYF